MTLPELIAALEAATRPSRELDFWVWWWTRPCADGVRMPPADYVAAKMWAGWADRYTSSLDAAMTLVTDGWDVTLQGIATNWSCALSASNGVEARTVATVPTPALALCIAATKARRT